jgi:hypothetical protein
VLKTINFTLLFLFLASRPISAILIEGTVPKVSSWIFSHPVLQRLNSSSTGLPQNTFSNMKSCSSYCIWRFYIIYLLLTISISFLTLKCQCLIISLLSVNLFSHIHDLRRIRCCVNHNTALTIATSFIHYRLDNCNSLFLNLPTSQLDHLQLTMLQLVLSPGHQNSLTFILFWNPFIGLQLMNPSTSRFSLLPIKFSKLINWSTFVIFSLFSQSQALVPLLLLLFIILLLLLKFT